MERFPNEFGIMPFKGFPLIHNILRKMQFVNDVRKASSETDCSFVNWFCERLSDWSRLKLPRSFGTLPAKKLLGMSRLIRLDIFEIDIGIIPLNLLSPI